MARSDMYEYRVDLNSWIELVPQHGAGSTPLGGGTDGGSPAASASNTVSMETTAEARFCHVACVYKDSMYIHAGYDGQSRLSDFKSYSFLDNIVLELPPPTILDDLKSFVNTEKFSDVKFKVDSGEIFYGHKLILTRCSYFKAMFETANLKESGEDTISISEVTDENFLTLISYLYSDEIGGVVSYEKAMEIFIVADRFGIDRLKRICEQSILSEISTSNACQIFILADTHNAIMLRKKSSEFILRHYDSVVKTEGFEDLARSNIELALELIRQR